MPDLWPWGIAATCFAVAIAATLKTVEATRLLTDEKKKSAQLEAEKTALQAEIDECNKGAANGRAQPIKYPRSNRIA